MPRLALILFCLCGISPGEDAPPTKFPVVTLGARTPIFSLDPFTLADVETFDWSSNVLEPLATRDPRTKKLRGVLATSWRLRGDRLDVTLRDNVRFHDGSSFGAEDVRGTLAAFRDPANQGAAWLGRWEKVKSISVKDKRHLEVLFTTLDVNAFENFLTTLRILPRSFYAQTKAGRSKNLVGTGPFRQDGETLEPNPRWWDKDGPRFSLRRKVVGDLKLAEQLFALGKIDIFALDASETSARGTRFKAGTGAGIWLSPNWRRPELRDMRVRKALLHLWNRDFLHQKMFSSRWALTEGAEPFDPKRAKRELADAGFGADHPLRLTLVVSPPTAERWATLFKIDAANVGVEVELERAPAGAQLWRRLNEGKFDLVTGTGGLIDTPSAESFARDGAYNFMGFYDSFVETKMDALGMEFDDRKRARLTRAILQRLRDLFVPMYGPVAPGSEWLISSRVRVDPDTPGVAWRWRLKPKN